MFDNAYTIKCDHATKYFVTDFLPVDKWSNVFRLTSHIIRFKNTKYLFSCDKNVIACDKVYDNFKNWPSGSLSDKCRQFKIHSKIS